MWCNSELVFTEEGSINHITSITSAVRRT
uniref:Uncharacterized protein n=1 Tax=Arundo donax TaxID=35708 RepID=A0A0A8ZZF8_ARUDO